MGYIYVYTGNGAGKTTNALGLALRAIGHKYKVIIIQFLKFKKNIGEYKIRRKLQPYYEIYQFGVSGFNFKRLRKKDFEAAEKGLEFAWKALRKKPKLLILDEINLAVTKGLIDVEKVIKLLDNVPRETTVILTGRYAPKKIIEKADFVNEIVEVKRPKKIIAIKGVNF
ncbi:MAG: cob(I)yrinic acid a,c-diamide adenosyltransferase [Candidatus Bathyarchaeia archaeon]|nr:cob(I)yrinic acid a,c-diamide adenosyltransferase [Candidatus Bathyarchaeota archaeon]